MLYVQYAIPCSKECIFIQTEAIHSQSGKFVYVLPPAHFWKTAGGIVLGSVTVSCDVLLYISVAIKTSFLKFVMCNIYQNNIAKVFLVFF